MTYSIIVTRLGGWVFAPESATVPRSHPDRAAISDAVFTAFRAGEYELRVTIVPGRKPRWRPTLKSR